MDKDTLSHIFEPFFTTKEVGKGTGMGLNISHSIIVQQHNGRFEVESQPGQTIFKIRLPREGVKPHAACTHARQRR